MAQGTMEESKVTLSTQTQILLLDTYKELARRYGFSSDIPNGTIQDYIAKIEEVVRQKFTDSITACGYKVESSVDIFNQSAALFDFRYLNYKVELTDKIAKYFATALVLLSYLRSPKVLAKIAQSLPPFLDYGQLNTKARIKHYYNIETNKVYFQDFLLARFMRPSHSAVVTVPKQNSHYGLSLAEYMKQVYAMPSGIDDSNLNNYFEKDILPYTLANTYPNSAIVTPQAVQYHKILTNILSAATGRTTYIKKIKKALESGQFNVDLITMDHTKFSDENLLAFPNNIAMASHQATTILTNANYIPVQAKFFESVHGNSSCIVGPMINVGNVPAKTIATALSNRWQSALFSSSERAEQLSIQCVDSIIPSLIKLKANDYSNFPKPLKQFYYSVLSYVDSNQPVNNNNLLDCATDIAALMPEYLGFLLWFISGLDINYKKDPFFSKLEVNNVDNEWIISSLTKVKENHTESIELDNKVNSSLLYSDIATAPLLDSFLSAPLGHVPLTFALQSSLGSDNVRVGVNVFSPNWGSLTHNTDHDVKSPKTSNPTFITWMGHYDTMAFSPAHFIYNLCGFPGILEFGNSSGFSKVSSLVEQFNEVSTQVRNMPNLSNLTSRAETSKPYHQLAHTCDPNVIDGAMASWYKGKTSCLDAYSSLFIDKELRESMHNDLGYYKGTDNQLLGAYDSSKINLNLHSFRRYQDYINYTAGFFSHKDILSSTPWVYDINFQYGSIGYDQLYPASLFAGGIPKFIADYLKAFYKGDNPEPLFKVPEYPGSQGPEPFVMSYLADKTVAMDSTDIKDLDKDHFFRKLYLGQIPNEELGLPEQIQLSELPNYIEAVANKLSERCCIKITTHDPVYSILYNLANNKKYLGELISTVSHPDIPIIGLLANILGNFNRPTRAFTLSALTEYIWSGQIMKNSIPNIMLKSLESVLGAYSLPETSTNILVRKTMTLDKFVSVFDSIENLRATSSESTIAPEIILEHEDSDERF